MAEEAQVSSAQGELPQTNYALVAENIIKSSIKSAILIDENAREAFAPASKEVTDEEKLSEGLFNSFKENSISLAIHRFQKGISEKTKNYLFDRRDLVLLDWKLDGKEGQQHALELLSDVVGKPHIHFCVIYTYDTKLEDVMKTVLTYFSGETSAFFKGLKEDFENHKNIAEIVEISNAINYYRDDKTKMKELITSLHSLENGKELMNELREKLGDPICGLIKLGYAFNDFIKSEKQEKCPEIISFDDNILVINNTIVLLLQKDYANDPMSLIRKIANKIIGFKYSFTQLMGLELQTLVELKGAFIDSNFIDVSKETLMHHRKKSKAADAGNDLPFRDLMKEILFEHLRSKLSIRSLNILDDKVLDELSTNLPTTVNETEILRLNTFYNSITLSGKKKLNFGDVFKATGCDDYYLCITPLCDCLYPDKIKHTYYFAKGSNFKVNEALDLGDTAFLSYIPKGKVIRWSEVDLDDKHSKYKPVYIKPLSVLVPESEIDTANPVLFKIINNGQLEDLQVHYVTTIKQNYAQRIANHAFANPLRVGIDFVKK